MVFAVTGILAGLFVLASVRELETDREIHFQEVDT